MLRKVSASMRARARYKRHQNTKNTLVNKHPPDRRVRGPLTRSFPRDCESNRKSHRKQQAIYKGADTTIISWLPTPLLFQHLQGTVPPRLARSTMTNPLGSNFRLDAIIYITHGKVPNSIGRARRAGTRSALPSIVKETSPKVQNRVIKSVLSLP